MKKFKPEVWVRKENGELYEHFYSIFGPAIIKTDTENPHIPFTNWTEWVDKEIFAFDDDELYDKKNFINLGNL